MGKIVSISDLPPPAVRAGRYDDDIKQALNMGKEQALEVTIEQGRKAANIGLAVRERVKRLGHEDRIHVEQRAGRVFIMHGPSPYGVGKTRGRKKKTD
jgi:ribosomal protein S4E